jgi:hypothetical protein
MPATFVLVPKVADRSNRVRRYIGSFAATVLGASVLLAASAAFAAQGPVGLGTADSFAVLAGSGITNTGPTTINGDVGTFPTPSETGFGSVTLTGTNHAGDAVTQGAKNDLVTAYNDAAGRTPVTNVPVELGGSTLQAGVYKSGSFGLTGTLTLDAMGKKDAEFIFQAGTTVIAETNSRVLLINGAGPCHVVWQLGSSATFKAGTQFVGDVLANTSITAQTGATFQGRLLALDGAVTLDTNTITKASCDAPSSVGPTPPPPDTTTGVPPEVPTEPVVTPGPATPSDGLSGPVTPSSPIGSPSLGGTPPTDMFGAPAGPGTPPFLTPFGPSTPGTPSRPDLPVTGAQLGAIVAAALVLLTLGALVVNEAKRARTPRTV